MTERRFDERLGPILLAIAFFGAGGGWLAWMMFVAGGNSDMILEFLNPR